MKVQHFPLIYVIVTNWNQARLTQDCVKSLLSTDYPNFRVVVVDNGSTDSSVKTLSEFGENIDLLTNDTNLGFTGGNNVGIRFALKQGAEHVMLLNNDTVVDRCFLRPMVDMVMNQPEIGAVTNKIYFLHEPEKIWSVGAEIRWWRGRSKSRGRNQVDEGQYDEAVPVDYGPGCCLLMTRSALQRVGLLYEPYFMYCEDADWCLRAWRAGFQVWYQPLSVIWHVAGASSRTHQPYLYYLTTRNNLWLINRNTTVWQKPIALASFAIRRLLWYTFGFLILRQWDKLRWLWLGVYDGWYKYDVDDAANTFRLVQ